MFSNEKIRSNSANSSAKECHHHGEDTRTDSYQRQVEEYITDNNNGKGRQEENLTNLVNNNSSGINYFAVYVKKF